MHIATLLLLACTGEPDSDPSDSEPASESPVDSPGDSQDTDDSGDTQDSGPRDSDGDRLSDHDEELLGTNPHAADSDDDGADDLIEVAAGTDPLDPSDNPEARGMLVVLMPFEGEASTHSVAVTPSPTSVDLVLLVDGTGTMGAEIAALQAGLSGSLLGTLEATAPDLHLGLARFEDYPVAPYGGSGDLPLSVEADLGATSGELAAASAGWEASGGGDGPESQSQALHALATGEGLGSWVAPRSDCAIGTWGQPCFREKALSAVLVWTDATWHNGPDGAEPYNEADLGFDAPSYEEAVVASTEAGLFVLGLGSGGEGLDELGRVAEDSLALRDDGSALVADFDADLEGDLQGLLEDLVSEATLDLGLALEDDGSDPWDATAFVQSLEPLAEGGGDCAAWPTVDRDGDGEHESFERAPLHTELCFTLQLSGNADIEETEEIQAMGLTLRAMGHERVHLGHVEVLLVVPPAPI